MKISPSATALAFALALTSAPMTSGYTLGPRLYGFPRSLVFSSPSQMIDRQQALMNRVFDNSLMKTAASSPRYQITDDDTKFQIAVDVPGVKMENIHVSVEEAGAILSISGHRESNSDTHSFKSKFAQSFSLDPTVDSDNFTANLENGVLTVSAPKDMKRIEANVRKIPITQLTLSEAPVEEKVDNHDEEVVNVEHSVPDAKEAVKVENEDIEERADIEL